MHNLVPEEKLDAVARGLRDEFGAASFEDIRLISAGPSTSVLVFRIVVRGRPFLLRIIMRADDASRHFACMRAAAEAGLAPRVWHTNAEDKISITDFAHAAPFPAGDALVRIPAALRMLHALPPFPEVPDRINTSCMFLMKKGPALDGFLLKFKEANILAPDEFEEFLALHARLCAGYLPQDDDRVSSHNDLKPSNIVFDGNRFWLVDWEAAFLNDRYSDLAAFSHFVVTGDTDEARYLEAYFGQPPGPHQRARFFLMRQVSHMFNALAYLWTGFSGKAIDRSEPIPEFNEFHRGICANEIVIEDKSVRTLYGRIHWKRLLANSREARFEESLQIVGGAAEDKARPNRAKIY